MENNNNNRRFIKSSDNDKNSKNFLKNFRQSFISISSFLQEIIFSTIAYIYSKIRFIFVVDEPKRLITNKNYQPKIVINHISEESIELENYIQNKLEEFFLNK
jgi:hypothetical protein